jgi:Homeodomain-like domain
MRRGRVARKLATMLTGLVSMSAREIDRLGVIARVQDGRLTQVKAAEILGLTDRQVRRLQAAYERQGAAGLVSRKRGRRSNNAIPAAVAAEAMSVIRDRYADFGPTLAAEKLAEVHGVALSRETVRKWMSTAGLWRSRRDRVPQPHQPRYRRECFGELVQIDGCEHRWFENRGPMCTLLVFVDDATGRLMELRFVASESTFDYFDATKSYVRRHGRPVAFYSDKHSIFRVAREGTSGRDGGVTQFGRAIGELGIDIICANTPQAKGRVERMNRTLQDRLVKELRLQGVCNVGDGNAFLPKFIEAFNCRFGRAPRNVHDAHRPAPNDQMLESVFRWRETRTMSRDLVVHYKRKTYLVKPTADSRALAGSKRQVEVHESADGRVEIRHDGHLLPYELFDREAHIAQGEIVENKRLGAALAAIQATHEHRDAARLASKKLTLREKARIVEARLEANIPPVPRLAGSNGGGVPAAVAEYIARFSEEQRLKRKRQNDDSNERKRQRQVTAARLRATSQVPSPPLRPADSILEECSATSPSLTPPPPFPDLAPMPCAPAP